MSLSQTPGSLLPNDAKVTGELVRRGLEVTFDTLPDDVVRMAELCLLDYVGVALAGASEPSARIMREFVSCEARGVCSLVAHPALVDAPQAALANGTAGHALDYDDVHLALPGHLTVTILPALLALAEARGLSGRSVMASFVAGYETGCRIGLLVGPDHYARGFHATATVGTFAAALAGAHLLGLGETQAINALAIAGAHAAGLKAQFGSSCKPLQAGNAARNGVVAALLAERGFDGAPDIFGDAQGFARAASASFDLDACLSSPPDEFHLRANLFKFHASCYGTQGLIEAARKVVALVANADILSISARVGAVNGGVCNIANPRTAAEAKFSLRHVAALALHGVDTSSIGSFDPVKIADPDIAATRDKVVIELDPHLTMTQASLAVRLADGRTIAGEHDASIPERDMTALEDRLVGKFHALVDPIGGVGYATEIAGICTGLRASADVKPLTRLMARAVL